MRLNVALDRGSTATPRQQLRQPLRQQLRQQLRQGRQVRSSAGEVTSTVILVPVSLFMIMVLIQAAFTFHARSVVTAAAQDYVRAEQAEYPGDGPSAAAAVLDGSMGLFASPPSVSASRDAEVIEVRVGAAVKSVVPGWTPYVTATSAGAVERFRAATER